MRRILRVTLAHVFVRSVLQLNIKKLTLRSFEGEAVVREVGRPEIDQEWLIDELCGNIEMQLSELEPGLSEAASHVNLIIRHRLQE